MNAIMAFAVLILEVAIVALFTILAFWHRDRLLYIISGFAWIVFGFSFWTTSHYLSILLVLGGIYNFIKAKWDKGG